MKTFSLLVGLVFILLIGAGTARDSDSPPENHPAYSSVLLWAIGFERDDQETIERSVIKSFKKKGINAVAMVDWTIENERYSRDQIRQLMKSQEISVVFELGETGKASWVQRFAGFVGSVYRSDSSPYAGVNPSVGGSTIVMRGMGGDINRQQFTKSFSAHLIDIEANQEVWSEIFEISYDEEKKMRIYAGKAFRKAAKASLKAGYFEP